MSSIEEGNIVLASLPQADMQTYFEDLYSYHHWANSLIVKTAENAVQVPSSAVRLFSHLLDAHFIWLDRIEGRQSTYSIWQEHTVKDWIDIDEQAYRRTISLIQSEGYKADYGDVVYYQNSKGEMFENSIQEILTHVSNHTTHHRAQVARELRLHNIPPPTTDYIFYKRESTNK